MLASADTRPKVSRAIELCALWRHVARGCKAGTITKPKSRTVIDVSRKAAEASETLAASSRARERAKTRQNSCAMAARPKPPRVSSGNTLSKKSDSTIRVYGADQAYAGP